MNVRSRIYLAADDPTPWPLSGPAMYNMTIIGTVANLPGPTVVSKKLANVRDWTVQHYNYARTYPFRPDQWYFKE